MFNFIKNLIFKYKYIVVSDFINGIDTRCSKKRNLYVGINNLDEFQVAQLLQDAYDLVVSAEEVKKKINELDRSGFGNKMITVNMFHYKDTYKTMGLHHIIVGNNFRSGIHHTMEFDYIDTIVVDNKIVIKSN